MIVHATSAGLQLQTRGIMAFPEGMKLACRKSSTLIREAPMPHMLPRSARSIFVNNGHPPQVSEAAVEGATPPSGRRASTVHAS